MRSWPWYTYGFPFRIQRFRKHKRTRGLRCPSPLLSRIAHMSSGPAGQVTGSSYRPPLETPPRTRLRRSLHTVDGVTIDAAYEPGTRPSGDSAMGSNDVVIVVAHGFTGDLDRPHVRRAAAVLARHAAVVTFSFRGHGASGGSSTVGDREVHDLAAAVAWARELGHTRVATVGFSMGGSVVLRHAALSDARTDAVVDAVVSVSAPARWYYRGTAPMRRLHWLVTRPVGRAIGRYGLRTRIHHRDWDPVPASPSSRSPSSRRPPPDRPRRPGRLLPPGPPADARRRLR